MEEIQQWTYVYWTEHYYRVLHQVPDPENPEYRVISQEIARETHQAEMPQGTNSDDAYAAKQIEIGLPYATAEWPLRTCQGVIIYPESAAA